MSYNQPMPKDPKPQITFRVSKEHKRRIDELVDAIDKRTAGKVERTAVLLELLNLKTPPELITESDRLFLAGKIDHPAMTGVRHRAAK